MAGTEAIARGLPAADCWRVGISTGSSTTSLRATPRVLYRDTYAAASTGAPDGSTGVTSASNACLAQDGAAGEHLGIVTR